MATRAVTGTILKPNGAPWKGAEVRFQLVDDTFRLSPDESYPLVAISVTTNDAGQISTTLNCGLDKAYLVTMPDRETFTIIVPCGAATTLEALRSESYGIPVPGGGTMVGPTGPQGDAGPAGGPTGRVGPGVVVMTRTFSTTTTDADPGSGVLRLNNATQNTATQAFIDLLDTAAVDQTALLDSLDDSTNTVKGYLRIEKQSASTSYLLFALTAVTTATGYRKLTLSLVDGSAASPFSNADPLFVTFVRAGDMGLIGPQGIQGAASTVTGPTGPIGSFNPTITSPANGQVITYLSGWKNADLLKVLRTSGSAVTASNSSTSTFQTFLTFTAVLPAGTWEVTTFVFFVFSNNAGNGATVQVSAPSASGGAIANGGSATDKLSLSDSSQASVVSDGVAATTFTSQYRAFAGGTVFAEAGSMLAICRRTA